LLTHLNSVQANDNSLSSSGNVSTKNKLSKLKKKALRKLALRVQGRLQSYFTAWKINVMNMRMDTTKVQIKLVDDSQNMKDGSMLDMSAISEINMEKQIRSGSMTQKDRIFGKGFGAMHIRKVGDDEEEMKGSDSNSPTKKGYGFQY